MPISATQQVNLGSAHGAADFAARAILRNRHVQTLGAAAPIFAPPRTFEVPATQWRKHALPNGGSLLSLGWFHPGAHPRPTVVVVHGVGGSSDSRYAIRGAVAMYRAGYHAIRLNLRGAGASSPDAPSLYHAGLTEDLNVVADALAKDARVTKTAFLGFSLGGNVTLKAAGEWGASPPAKVAGVASVSAPMDLAQTSRLLETVGTLPYRAFILAGLFGQAKRFAERHPSRARFAKRALYGMRTIRDYDEVVIAPMHGFANADAYYAATSSGQFLPRIRVPALVVHADDDPIVPGYTVTPWLDALGGLAPDTRVEVAWTQAGGHVGWFAGLEEKHWVNTWAIERVLPFLARVFAGSREEANLPHVSA